MEAGLLANHLRLPLAYSTQNEHCAMDNDYDLYLIFIFDWVILYYDIIVLENLAVPDFLKHLIDFYDYRMGKAEACKLCPAYV